MKILRKRRYLDTHEIPGFTHDEDRDIPNAPCSSTGYTTGRAFKGGINSLITITPTTIPLFATAMKHARLTILSLSFMLSCLPQLHASDSAVTRQFTAIDISVDFGGFQTGFERELYILGKLVDKPQTLQRITSDYTFAEFIQSSTKINLDLIFSIEPLLLKRHFRQQELKFGVAVLMSNSTIMQHSYLDYDSLGSKGEEFHRSVSFNYYFHREHIQGTYLLNSRVFGKNFRYYTGLGLMFGLGTWKGTTRNTISALRISQNWEQDSAAKYKSDYYPLGSYSSGNVSVFIPIGLKYNLSCDLNLFADWKFGIHYYPKFERDFQIQNFYSFCLGVRYKFRNSEVDTEKNTSFW